jgi:hypothetical protein
VIEQAATLLKVANKHITQVKKRAQSPAPSGVALRNLMKMPMPSGKHATVLS